jgi:2',3'-cyclic-nucleotide 2'-phosphodiesterase (5'-nucleotidase family)
MPSFMQRTNRPFLLHAVIALALILHLGACGPVFRATEMNDQQYRFAPSVTATSPAVDSLIAPYKKTLDAEMNAVIGTVEHSLEKGKPESTLGNWVADALLDFSTGLGYEVDFAIQNYGGLRIGELPEGTLRLGQIYELMPFDNTLVILEADAGDLGAFFERIARYGGWPVSREVRMEIRQDSLASLSLSGKPVGEGRTYRIAMPDYIANGGDNCDFFVDNPRENTGVLIRDILVRKVRETTEKGDPVRAVRDGRIFTAE